ncbi:hypothetical protein K469DRAFT_731662 [Zopfia rhizophila CBS 207.26]|uniref:DUF7708 domain-containing protein n=1 Tax=Zopfia rhizophila CBS 207.26 TaxID=1314779 RepID=A0A6A6DHQ3_9PEZI|nr:hypothetical protein K469DRAFT_731662 [Zopfia rhizophila CBS 207.26]
MAQKSTGAAFLGGFFDKVLENAFTEGRQTFNDVLCDREKDKAWISDRASIKDVLQAVSDARDKYRAKRTSKAWKWLTQLSARVNYYGSILDVMVQHHPEYAALAWGAMKVLFVGVENHEESVHQLAKALYRFADCLPRQELKLILYPSLQMQQAVAKLYSRLIQFMVHAMHWYQKGKARRGIGAIFKPFALDFQDQLTEVDELSRSVDEIANTAAQAELRAVHAKVEDAYKELGDAHKELSLARLEIKRLGEVVSLEADRVFQVASCTQSLSSQIQLDIRTQSTMIRTVQLNQIMSAPFMTDIPSSGQSLKYCSTFARRQPQSVTLSQSEIEILRNCSTDVDISYLVMETRDLSDAKILLLSLLQQIQTANRPVIWALRFANFLDRSPCIEDILRILVLHALEINSNALALNDFPVTLPGLRAASSQEDWLSILDRSLAGLEEVYIVVDPDLLRFAAENNTCAAADVLLALKSSITSTRLKIIVSSFGINKGYFARHSAAGSWKAIRTNDAQRQRLAKMKRQHLARVRKMRNS